MYFPDYCGVYHPGRADCIFQKPFEPDGYEMEAFLGQGDLSGKGKQEGCPYPDRGYS